MPYFDEAAYPVPGEADAAEISVRIEEFPFLTALGIPADEAAVLAVTQRPLDAEVLAEPATVAAWLDRPSWGVVATADRLINPEAVRFRTRPGGRARARGTARSASRAAHPPRRCRPADRRRRRRRALTE